ncbi:hypothetical protein AAG570_000987 [Ranatra chinensis]|uniref:Uncharacterized protein n=1 Tax=Ranatra chinensis TaxID=642074 RepID=A0ABD0YX11_9HEMI
MFHKNKTQETTEKVSVALKMKLALGSKRRHAATLPQTREGNDNAHSTRLVCGTPSEHCRPKPFDNCRAGRGSQQRNSLHTIRQVSRAVNHLQSIKAKDGVQAREEHRLEVGATWRPNHRARLSNLSTGVESHPRVSSNRHFKATKSRCLNKLTMDLGREFTMRIEELDDRTNLAPVVGQHKLTNSPAVATFHS